jgi:hypothetical protein
MGIHVLEAEDKKYRYCQGLYILYTYGLFIYSTKACLRGKKLPRLGHLAPASEVAGGHTLPF